MDFSYGSPLRKAVGSVLLMIGVVWFLLAVGFVEGSFMRGSIFWGIVGLILGNAGAVLLFYKPKAASDDDASS